MTIKAGNRLDPVSLVALMVVGAAFCVILMSYISTLSLRPSDSAGLHLPAPLVPTAEYLLANPAPLTHINRAYAYRKADGLTRMCAEMDWNKNIGEAWEFIIDGTAIQPDRWDCAEAQLDDGLHLVRAQERDAQKSTQNLRFYEWAIETQNLSSSTPTPFGEGE